MCGECEPEGWWRGQRAAGRRKREQCLSTSRSAHHLAHLSQPALLSPPPLFSQTLWGNCTKPEWAGYCDESCGRCPSTFALVGGSLTPSESEPGVATATIVPSITTQPNLGADLDAVDVTLAQITPSIARVRLSAKGRWEVPRDIFTNVVPPSVDDATADPLFELETAADPFAVRVRRAGEGGGVPLFDTSGKRLVLKDQYLEISTALPPTSNVYGLGESTATTGMVLPRDG